MFLPGRQPVEEPAALALDCSLLLEAAFLLVFIFAEFALLVVSHEATGWLLGVTFYRLGFWRGLAFAPLSIIPAAATEFLLVAQWLGGPLSELGYHRPSLAIAVPAVVVVTALGLYAGHRLLQPMPLKPAKG